MMKRNNGFTLIELTLVMTAMSVLLLGVLYATLHAGTLYDKGMTNRTVNQISRDVSDNLRRDFMSVDPAVVKSRMSGTGQSGRICLGSVSYLWNTASALNDPSYRGITDQLGKNLVFVRVIDPTQYYCVAQPPSGTYPAKLESDAIVTNMISGEGKRFAVYSLAFTPLTPASVAQGLFEIEITIGTNNDQTTQTTKDRKGADTVQCAPPSSATSDFTYCSVVDMDLIVRAGGNI